MAVRRLVILRAAPSEGLPNITNGLAVPLRSILNQSRVSCRFCIGTDVRVSWASRLVVQTDGANLVGDPSLCRPECRKRMLRTPATALVVLAAALQPLKKSSAPGPTGKLIWDPPV